MELYRYHLEARDEIEIPDVDVKLTTFIPFKETECGWWIKVKYPKPGNKWVSKSGKKRYAYSDKELALTNFIKRTTIWRGIVNRKTRNCDIALNIARIKQNDLKKKL